MDHDRRRRLTVTVCGVLCLVGTLIGVGALGGTPVAETAGGALAADATVLAPASSAFTIWSVIYVGLAAYVVWQWLPARRTDARCRATGWLAAVSLLTNAGWLLVTQQGWVAFSVVVILAQLAVLSVLVRRLVLHRADGWADRVVVDGTFGLYLGWTGVATLANVAAAVEARADFPVAAGVAVLLATAAAIWWAAYRLPRQWTVAVAAVWGLGWIAVGRLADAPASTLVGVTALVAAASVVVAFAVMSTRARPAAA